jgi:hypothetical protein
MQRKQFLGQQEWCVNSEVQGEIEEGEGFLWENDGARGWCNLKQNTRIEQNQKKRGGSLRESVRDACSSFCRSISLSPEEDMRGFFSRGWCEAEVSGEEEEEEEEEEEKEEEDGTAGTMEAAAGKLGAVMP